MNPNAKNLTGQKIRLYRKQRGWTQNMLAASLQKMGVPITRHIIANIETQRCSVPATPPAVPVPLRKVRARHEHASAHCRNSGRLPSAARQRRCAPASFR
jgi:DNA-binding XRE family transcriptional regulator